MTIPLGSPAMTQFPARQLMIQISRLGVGNRLSRVTPIDQFMGGVATPPILHLNYCALNAAAVANTLLFEFGVKFQFQDSGEVSEL